jgi:hypothetical protein
MGVTSRGNALLLWYPVLDNGPGGYGYSLVKERYGEISPLDNIDSRTPPALLFLGTKAPTFRLRPLMTLWHAWNRPACGASPSYSKEQDTSSMVTAKAIRPTAINPGDGGPVTGLTRVFTSARRQIDQSRFIGSSFRFRSSDQRTLTVLDSRPLKHDGRH